MATKKPTTAKEIAPVPPAEIPANGKVKTTTKKSVVAKVTDAVKEAITPATEISPAPAKKATSPKTGGTTAKKTVTAEGASAIIKVYGEIQVSGNTFFIHKGSVPEGQLQLTVDKGKEELLSRIPNYSGQFVTVLGKSVKKKTGQGATFLLQNIASHDQIGQRAYELSQENPTAVEENWFRAENELLYR